MKRLKIWIVLVVALIPWSMLHAHGGEDHTKAPDPKAVSGKQMLTVTAISESYEWVLRYAPFASGELAKMTLFISEYASNAPVANAKLRINVAKNKDLKIKVTTTEPGIYLLEGTFPTDGSYDLNIELQDSNKADNVTIAEMHVGKLADALPGKLYSDWAGWPKYLWLGIAFLAGMLLMWMVQKRKGRKQ